MRIGFVLASVAAVLALAPSAAGAVLPGEPARAAEDAASELAACADPCPTYLWFKGPGSGRVRSQEGNPPYVDCTNTCSPSGLDSTTLGTETLTLYATTTDGRSFLERWEGCPDTTTSPGNCRISMTAVGANYTICAVFNVAGAPPVSDRNCPPVVVSPSPPPPPSGPPRLGSRCTIKGTARADVMNGTTGRDVICGRGGNDRINGRGNHDLILGGGGADRLTGGNGRDSLYGNSGNDTLSARDGVRDTVNGGRGRDRARWDAHDVRRSIERRL